MSVVCMTGVGEFFLTGAVPLGLRSYSWWSHERGYACLRCFEIAPADMTEDYAKEHGSKRLEFVINWVIGSWAGKSKCFERRDLCLIIWIILKGGCCP